jgi:hypothetical protein
MHSPRNSSLEREARKTEALRSSRPRSLQDWLDGARIEARSRLFGPLAGLLDGASGAMLIAEDAEAALEELPGDAQPPGIGHLEDALERLEPRLSAKTSYWHVRILPCRQVPLQHSEPLEQAAPEALQLLAAQVKNPAQSVSAPSVAPSKSLS